MGKKKFKKMLKLSPKDKAPKTWKFRHLPLCAKGATLNHCAPRGPPGVTLRHSLTVTLSSRARSSSQFHSIWKESRKEGPLSNPRTNCSVYESIISCAHWKPTPSTKRSARLPPTPRNKQTFLKILALCREKTSTLEKTESYCEKARPRRKQTRQSWNEK